MPENAQDNSPTHAQFSVGEILMELSFALAGHDGVDRNSQLLLAQSHGIGYLTGSAAAMLESIGSDDQCEDAEWEEDAMFVLHQIVLAIVERRRLAAQLVSDDDGDNNDFVAVFSPDKDE